MLAAIAATLLLGAAPDAIAQRDGADRADRGQRLDSNELRDDMLQNQLKQPTNPQGGQATVSPDTSKKSKSSKRKSQPN
ncbi:MAG: hypothetical protein WDO17_25535 [Alphaproteobacteria bacterium]